MHQIVDVSWPQRSYHPGAEEAVFVAATSGDGGTLFVQSTFQEDVANARADGKALGFYHFNGAQQAAASAEAFWAAIKPYWRPGDLVALDIESYNGGKTPAQSWQWALAFANRLAQLIGISVAQLRLGIYGNRSTMSLPGWGALERAGCWLWLAAPGGYPENTPIGEWSRWTVLQYSSAGGVDRDESESTFAQIAGALTTAALAASTLQEDEMPKLNAIRNWDGSIGIVDDAGLLTVLTAEGEWESYERLGIVQTQPDGQPYIQQGDGTVWNALAAVTARVHAQQAGDAHALAQGVGTLLVPIILDALQKAGAGLTQAQVEAASEQAIKDVLAAAATAPTPAPAS